MRRTVALLLLCGLVAHGTLAIADDAGDAADARAHYESAQRLYDEGRYRDAIDDFQVAYRKKPHPSVLYNIGQAYERLLDYGSSVTAFTRYLAEAEPSDPRRKIVENRLRILRALPARISVSSIPDRVHAVLRGEQGAVHVAETPHEFSVPAGDYTLELTREGWQTEKQRVHVEIGQPYFYQYRLERSTVETRIETDPSGARVFIDERLVGETPYRGRLEVGRHDLLIEYPNYPWRLEVIMARDGTPLVRNIRLDRPSRSGRTELVLSAMAYGGVVGPLLVGALSGSTQFTESGQGVATLLLSSAAGIGAGFVGAFLTTRNGVSVGTSSLVIGGGGFGSGMGAALALGLNTSERSIYGITLLGGAVGITTAALVAHFAKVSEGDAAIVNSGGLWGTGGAALLAQAIPWNGERANASITGWFVLGGSALGIAAGALSARFLERSRAEVAIVDLSGLVGTGLGFALGYAVGSNNGGDAIAQGSRFALGGMALGLVSGAFVARGWGKKRFHLPATKQVQLDMPQLRFRRDRTAWGEGMTVSLDLVQGRW